MTPTPTQHSDVTPSTVTPAPVPAMTITLVTLEQAETKQGVIFWWSNILRGYQLRFEAPLSSPSAQALLVQTPTVPPPEVRMPQIYLSRAEVENAAFTLAKHLDVAIYEIEIPRLNGAANE